MTNLLVWPRYSKELLPPSGHNQSNIYAKDKRQRNEAQKRVEIVNDPFKDPFEINKNNVNL